MLWLRVTTRLLGSGSPKLLVGKKQLVHVDRLNHVAIHLRERLADFLLPDELAELLLVCLVVELGILLVFRHQEWFATKPDILTPEASKHA